MYRSLFPLIATAVIPLTIADCKKEAPADTAEAPEATMEDAATSQIGVLLTERRRGEYQIGNETVVVGTVSGSSAEDVLREDDVILAVQGTPIDGSETVTRTIGSQPIGAEITLVVRRDGKKIERKVRTERKMSPSEMLGRTYVGKPLPSFRGIVSVAETDAEGDIVPDSQCVISPRSACDRYGKPGATNFANGPVTVVVFLQWIHAERNKDLVSAVHGWQKDVGLRGLRVVAVTPAPPNAVPDAVKESELDDMTVVSMFHGDYGDTTLAQFASPCVIVLDGKGVVRGAATADGTELLADQVIRPLLRNDE